MPRRVQLPDGRWIYVPDLDPYLEQISYGSSPIPGLPWGMEEEEEEEDEGTLAGSAWEGIKSIPSGVADIFLSGAQAAVGVATPFADLPVEKRLRQQASKRARERDPAYQDAFLPAVGTGLGQVAGLSALSRLPGGWYAAMGAGIGMGISDQTRRIADYEQRTGTDVPWYKESAAHMMGALIGLTEVIPVKFGIFPTSVSKMMDRMKSGLSPNSLRRVSQLEAKYGFRDIATTALMEATQEASANWLQSVSARGLYDPDAMKDLARSMAEDFKVGGAVGGLVKLAQHQIFRYKIGGGSSDRNANAEVMRARYRHDQIIKDVSSNITGISEEMSPVLSDLGIGRGLATDIIRLMGGEFSAIPTGLDHVLSSGEISRFQVKGLIKEFTARNESAKSQLDRLIEYHSNAGNDTEVERYIKARVAIDKMATARINNLAKNLPGLEGGLGDMGGLTGNMQYEEAKEAAIDADAVESMMEVHEARKKQKEYSKKPSFLTAIRSLMGGSYKLSGLFHMAESLGTHRGPGSEKVHLESLADDTQTIPDIELASSDRSNFDIASLGEMLFASRGKHEEASSDQQYVDKSDVMDGFRFGDSVRGTLGSTQRTDARRALYDLDVKLEAVEKNNDALYKKHIFTRELSEIDRKKKYDSDEEWTQHRDETQSYISRQSQQNNAEISRINRERSIIYLRLLSDRLQSARTYFAGNISAKQKAAQRVLGSPNTDRFDLWLDKTINTVIYSEHNGQRMKDLASEKAREFEEGLAAETDVPDAEKEAARAAFISENTRRFVQLPRDISATQVTKIASLFVEDSKESENVLEDAFEKRALADITVWRADDELYDVDPYGIPIVKKTRKVVAELEKKLERPLTDESGKIAPKKMHKEDISVNDIEKLLASKNIYLRDEIRIGSLLAKETGTGVESRPFEKLLEDMTGALSWENATYGQRLLMYSRLLQLPAHYKSRSSPEDRRYLLDRGTIEGVFEEADYRPLFLPDFYHNPSIDSHINFMADRVMEVTVEEHLEFPSVSVGTLKRRTQAALGDKFNSKAYYESLARLIETGAFNRTAEPAPARVSTREQMREEAERAPSALSENRVRFNVNFEPTEPSAGELRITEPGDDTRARDEKMWTNETNPGLVHRLLSDPQWKNQIDDMLDSYNERRPGAELNREEFVRQYTALVTSVTPLQDLSDLGILDTIQGAVAMPGGLAPTENILDLGSPAGKNLVRALMKSGALPSSLRDNVHAVRRRFVDTMKTRFETLDGKVEELVQAMRLPDNIQRQYVDDIDGLFQFMGEVAIRGEDMNADLPALYDRPGNRIIINLAAIDPNDMISAQEVVKQAAFHEGLHALIIRDHLTEEELNVLYGFVRDKKNIVPKEIDEEAYNAQLTWFERSVVAHKDSELAEADIEKEAIISLLENLTQHPDLYVEGKKTRTITKDVRGFLEGFVDAAKDSDIVDVMRILGRIERGEVGERTAGFLGDTEYTNDSIVRSNDLLRYANPEDIRKLKAAIVLRDAAPSDQMREVEQAKIDDISDKIVANRGIIQESAPPPPDAVQAIENQRQAIEHYRATFSGEVPLLSLDQKNRDSEAYKLALDTFMEMRGKDPRYAYKMPEPYQRFFNKMSPLSPNLLDLVADVEKAGVVTPLDGDVTRKSLEEGGILGGDYVRRPWWKGGGIEGDLSEADTETLKDQPTTGDNIKDTVENLKGSVDGLRYLYLDRRQYIVKQTDKLIAAQNRAQLDAETSALVMWRNSDNALNWLSSLMLRGPLSYLGTTVGSGRFENAPIYDNDLQEKYGGDGRVQGLNDIIAPIIDADSQQAALTYGLIKRVRWTRDRLESIQLATAGVDPESLNPETRRKLELFKEAYEDIKVAVRKLTEAQMDDIVQEIETKESNKIIIEFWDRYKAYDNHMIKMSYNTGMITREVRDEWLSMPYAPFYRETMENEDFPIGSREQIAKRRKNVVEKALTESMKPITSKLADSIITNTQALVRDAMMNTAVSRTVRDAVALGEARKINISAVAASLDDRVVRVMEHGVPTYYQLDDAQVAMSAMLLGFNPKRQLQKLFGEHKLGKFMQRALTGTSSFLRDAVTRTPPFATKNVFRDSWNAMSLTGGGPRLILEAFGNAINPDSLRRADELGLSIGIDFVAEPGEYGNKMRSELKKANLDWKNPLNAFSIFWNFSGRIAKQSEVATRLAVYDRILAMTGDKALALHYAIEIMNYGRRGASPVLSTYMATVPFMNGRLEGLDVTYRGLRSKKGSSDIPGVYGYGLTTGEYEGLPFWKKTRAKVVSRGLALTAATGVLYLLMRDDEEWQDLRDETRSDNWVLPLSDHAWIKIPIPFEIGVIFKVIPEKMFEAITEADVDVGDVGEEAWRQLRTSLSIGGPQLFTPVVNAMRNYDTFRKDGIVDSWMEDTLSPNEQRNRYTSNVARGVADLANSVPLVNKMDFLTSPMKVEYMMRQYLGTMGSYVVTVADRIARTGILPDIPFDPYMNLAEAESVIGTNKDFDWKSLIGGEGIANVPLLGDLLTDPRTRQGSQQAFFEMIEDLDTVLATLSSITDRDYLKGFEYRKKHLDILRHQRQLRFMQNQLKQWRERRDHFSKIPLESMSTDEGREYYQRLLESRQSILASVNDLMASIRQE